MKGRLLFLLITILSVSLPELQALTTKGEIPDPTAIDSDNTNREASNNDSADRSGGTISYNSESNTNDNNNHGASIEADNASGSTNQRAWGAPKSSNNNNGDTVEMNTNNDDPGNTDYVEEGGDAPLRRPASFVPTNNVPEPEPQHADGNEREKPVSFVVQPEKRDVEEDEYPIPAAEQNMDVKDNDEIINDGDVDQMLKEDEKEIIPPLPEVEEEPVPPTIVASRNVDHNPHGGTVYHENKHKYETKDGVGIPNGQPPIPYVPKSSSSELYTPPEGFQIAARVYTSPTDQLAYIQTYDSYTLPYWDCGVRGSTTAELPLSHATFRHALATSVVKWSGTQSFHAELMVAVTPLIITVNSGAVKKIDAGQVVLLEDRIPGHQLQPWPGNGSYQVLMLTLPTSIKMGASRSSLDPYMEQVSHPCSTNISDSMVENSPRRQIRPFRLRHTVLGVLGLSLSTLLADFLGKTAPLWLAVGIGGSCLVVSGTLGTIWIGDSILEAWKNRNVPI